MKSGFKIGIALAASVAAGALLLPGLASGTSPSAAAPAKAVLGFTGPFHALLSGANEVPPADPDAVGGATVTINTTTNEICYDLVISNTTTPTMAHIHEGAAGTNGPVVVPLDTPTNGQSDGCVTDTDAPAIAANPAGYYVNVHTADFPNGAARGQLALSTATSGGITLLPTPLRAYDSRDGDGPLALNTSRTISLLSGKDGSGVTQLAVPPGATGALVTLTATDTTGPGFLKIYSAASPLPATSNLNFTTANENVAVGTTTAIDAQSRVIVTDGAASTQFVVDVIGYLV
jgi:hypothetical protein